MKVKITKEDLEKYNSRKDLRFGVYNFPDTMEVEGEVVEEKLCHPRDAKPHMEEKKEIHTLKQCGGNHCRCMRSECPDFHYYLCEKAVEENHTKETPKIDTNDYIMTILVVGKVIYSKS